MSRKIQLTPLTPEITRGLLDIPEHGWAAIAAICKEVCDNEQAQALQPDIPDHVRQYRTGNFNGVAALSNRLFNDLARAKEQGRPGD